MSSTIWRSKVDLWLLLVLAISVIASIMAIGSVVWQGQMSWWSAVLVVVVLVGPLGWLLASTHYALSRELLLIRSGPFTWRIPVAQIVSITPSRNPLSSPALSLDRLRIEYGNGRWILISPNDKEAFMRAVDRHREAAREQRGATLSKH